MTCLHCAAARTNPYYGKEDASCRGCQTRALANSPQFWRSMTDGQQTPGYRKALVAVFGEEGAATGHQAVKTEYQRLKTLRGGTP
ncbi:MAG TPA: hypothetical protein VMA55_06700 [Acidovorax sp.]|nr:hypothetical protein [Acidovorax sp.]